MSRGSRIESNSSIILLCIIIALMERGFNGFDCFYLSGLMLLSEKSFAVIGASNNPEKYGHKVVAALKKISAKVFPINPNEENILGLKVYKSVNEVKESIDIVVFVVPPVLALALLKEIKDKNMFFWFQVGSYDNEVIAYCKERKLQFNNTDCIIVESEKQGN
jgi:uncharacterized protein